MGATNCCKTLGMRHPEEIKSEANPNKQPKLDDKLCYLRKDCEKDAQGGLSLIFQQS